MRRHVSCVMGFGGDLRVDPRGRQRQNGMVRVVERMDRIMRGAGMVGVLSGHLHGDRAGLDLAPNASGGRADGTEQRERVEGGRL